MRLSVRARYERLLSAAIAAAVLGAVALPATPAWADRRTDSQTAYSRAFALFQKDDLRAARIELLKALKAEPNNPLNRLLSARVALGFGAGVAAQTEIEKARALGVPRDKTRHLMAEALMLQGKGQEALGEADSSTVPPQFAAYAARIRARAQMVAAQPERARGEFELATRLAPNDVSILLDRARFEMLTANSDKAAELVDHALQVRPTSSRALVLKGDIVRAKSGLAQSLPYFTQAIQADPNSIEALLERAATYGDLRREAESRADLKRVDAIQPNQPLGLYLTAVLEARAGRYQAAADLMTKTKGVLDTYPPAMMLQGMVDYQLGNTKAAQEFLSRVIASAPNYVLARRLLASTQLRNGDSDASLTTLKPLLDVPQPDGATLTMAAQAYARKGDFNNAKALYTRAAKALPNSQDVRTQLAMTQVASGENAAAAANLNAALKTSGNDPRALATLTLLNLRQNKFQEALASSSKLIAAQPNMPLGYNMRGAAYLGLNDSKNGEANFRQALAKDPKFAEARRNLAQLLIATNRTAEAKTELLKVVNANGKDVQAMMLLASIAQRKANSTERLQWLNQAVAANPTAIRPRMALAQAYVQAGQTNRAVTTARAIERDFPSDPSAIEMVGMTSLAAKNTADAEDAFKRLVAAMPNEVGPRILLARTQAAANRFADARRTYGEALNLKTNLIPVYVDAVRLELANNKPADAQAMLARFRAAYPKSNVPDLLAGDDFIRKGQVPQAIAAYNQARKVSFDRTAATRLSTALQGAGQPQQAITVLRQYQGTAKGDPLVGAAIAEIQLSLRQYKPAIATYEAMLPQGGDRAPAILNNLAWAYHQVGEETKAVSTVKRAMAFAPNSPEIMDTYGTILVDTRQDKVKGQTLIEQAVKQRPRDPNMRYHLAVARVVNHRPKEALEELALALKAPRFDSRNGALALQKRLLAQK